NRCPIKDNDLARFNSSADLRGANTVGSFCRFNQDKARQQTVQVQTHMQLGGGFASTVLCPVDAGGNQGDSARIHHMNDPAETTSQPFTSTPCPNPGENFFRGSDS